jgi:hypothetical protein
LIHSNGFAFSDDVTFHRVKKCLAVEFTRQSQHRVERENLKMIFMRRVVARRFQSVITDFAGDVRALASRR